MGFVKQRTKYNTDKKKMISARVSKDVMDALSSAEEDAEALGYGFSITQIIEEAFSDTLKELKQITGIDHYKLIKWKQKILDAESRLPRTQALNPINIDDQVELFKEYFIHTRSLDGVVGFDELLQRHEDSIVDNWNSCIKEQNAEVAKNTLEIFYGEPSVGEFASAPVKNASGHTVQTLSKLLKKSPDEVIEILNNAGVTGKNSDSRISTDDRQKLMNSISRNSNKNINIKLK
mgnify:FL=1|jgi:hypothetical protein